MKETIGEILTIIFALGLILLICSQIVGVVAIIFKFIFGI